MPVNITLLHNKTDPDVDASSYTTPSLSPAANALLLVCVSSAISAGTAPTVSVTSTFPVATAWAQEEQVTYSSATVRRIVVWRAVTGAAPGSGTLTVTWSASSTASYVGVAQATEVVLGVPILTSIPASGSDANPLVALGSGAPASRPFSFLSSRGGGAVTPRAGWTELHDLSHASPTAANQMQWRSDAWDATADATVITGDWGIIGLELNGGGASPPPPTFFEPVYHPQRLA